MSKQVEYFLAPQSPFVYLGHARFMEIANRHQAQVRQSAGMGWSWSMQGQRQARCWLAQPAQPGAVARPRWPQAMATGV